MKTIITTAAAALFAANVGAADIYHGLAEGNGDLSVEPLAFAADFVGTRDTDPDIYGNLRGNPDLSF